jgi:hypothetical protein
MGLQGRYLVASPRLKPMFIRKRLTARLEAAPFQTNAGK